MPTRFRALLAAALLSAIVAPPAGAATQSVGEHAFGRAVPASVGSGGVAINGSAATTRSVAVTVSVPAPTTTASTLRMSNDGVAWVEMPWAMAIAWSLVDPAAGGVDVDGTKTVVVQGGPGDGTWTAVGQASILLDRTGPLLSVSPRDFENRPIGFVDVSGTDDGSGIVRYQISLDGIQYRQFLPNPWSFRPPNFLDLREGMIGGSWEPGERTVYVRAIDAAGNIGDPATATVQATVMRIGDDGRWSFRFPKQAVTNEPYTIEPVFDPGFTVPAGRTCQWRLRWGNEDVRLEGHYDETYGEVLFTVSPAGGKCAPWTFTLPYTPPREYTWSLSINSGPDVVDYSSSGSFRAELGGTSRAITTSNLPLYYMLPDRLIVGTTGIVTYRLYASGGAAPPTGGHWGCDPADGSPSNVGNSQYGGTRFDCRVTTSEAWVAQWGKFTSTRRWLVGYDPVGDRSRPTMSSIRVRPAPGFGIGSGTQTALLSWSGRDSGSGVNSYSLQISKNGGSWVAMPLSSAKATSTTRTLANGATYRFRVRAKDRAGNIGAWLYAPPIRPTVYDEVTSISEWTTGWYRVPLAGAYGGKVRRTTTTRASTTFRFTGLSVGLVAARGPDAGFAQVYADGTLVDTIDLHAASAVPPRVVWSKAWSTTRAHTLRVRVLGTATHPAATVDAFVTFR